MLFQCCRNINNQHRKINLDSTFNITIFFQRSAGSRSIKGDIIVKNSLHKD